MNGYGTFFSVPRKRSSVPIFMGRVFPNQIATAGAPLFTLQEYSFIISACSQYHVKGQPHFPCLRQNSFPFARMKTEQKTSSGNRAQAPLPEPFLFPKTKPGNRKETMREQFGKHRGNPFREQYQPHRGNPYWNLLRCPRSNLIQPQNTVIPGVPAHWSGFRKREPQQVIGLGTVMGTASGTTMELR